MFQAKCKLKYKSDYHFEVIDSRTGTLKSECRTHNVICTNFYNPTAGRYHVTDDLIKGIQVGTGSGTPAESDTALFKAAWSIGLDSQTYTYPDEFTLVDTVVGTIPADTGHVGTITEVGLLYNYGGSSSYDVADLLITHALLKDAEGNPISIEKTDIDKVIVTVTMTITLAAADPWKPALDNTFIYSARLRQEGWNYDGTFVRKWVEGYVLLCPTLYGNFFLGTTYDHTWIANLTVKDAPRYGYHIGTLSMNQAQKKLSMGTARLAQNIAADVPAYINAVAAAGFCYVTLPNAEVFPNYTMKDIAVGTGDGTTKEFLNPLNYFVKDTDVIYINGNALTRGVDYTIDYRNNHQRLPDLGATAKAIIKSGLLTSQRMFVPFQRYVSNGGNDHRVNDIYYGWDKDHPMVIDCSEKQEVNSVYLPGWITGQTCTIAYSNDGEEWTDWLTFDHAGGTADLKQEKAVSARYWKFSGNNSSFATWYRNALNIDNEIYLGYLGEQNIIFKEAPAADAVITMDVQMDRPFKNGNYVIDTALEIQL